MKLAPLLETLDIKKMTNVNWPDKDEREKYEINEFIAQYARLPNKRCFEIVEKREKPDYFVRDKETGKEYGIELTSVYFSDTSVPNEHIPAIQKGIGEGVSLDRNEIEEYKRRVVATVERKIEKAINGYDLSRPLILSVYVNEYRAIFMSREDWGDIVDSNKQVFDGMRPFKEIVFWALANNDVFSVTPDDEIL